MLTEKEEKAREKAKRLVAWFDGRELPKCPFKINDSTTVHDINRALEVASGTALNSKPYSAPFLSSYNHLLIYKKFIENVSK